MITEMFGSLEKFSGYLDIPRYRIERLIAVDPDVPVWSRDEDDEDGHFEFNLFAIQVSHALGCLPEDVFPGDLYPSPQGVQHIPGPPDPPPPPRKQGEQRVYTAGPLYQRRRIRWDP